MNSNFSKVVTTLAERYTRLLAANGDSPGAVEQSNLSTQERRMRQISAIGDLRHAKVLDFGCGTGHLLTVLENEFEFAGDYHGYDITPGLIDLAREKFHNQSFEVRNIFEDGIPERFDYVLVSGVFNNLVGDNWEWMTQSLELLFSCADKGIAFNNLSRYVDYFDDHLFYVDPGDVFKFCKEKLSPLVTLHHDYQLQDGKVPYEFTTFVYRSEVSCRSLNLKF